jgi:ribosomal protein S18 acetylase RimI-like enzyme
MDNETVVRHMLESDLNFAAECTANEGWTSETRTEFEGFLAYDPQGCFVAETGGQRVGICVANPYGRAGSIGQLIVAREWRGRGIGRQLMERAIGHLHGRGVQRVFLDGMPLALPLYERLGFRKVARSLRFAGRMSGAAQRDVRPMHARDLPAVLELDREAFGADRSFFLRRRLSLYPELSKVLEWRGRVVGFILGRRGPDWAAAGPWVVGPATEDPVHLLQSLALEVEGITMGVGALETNVAAIECLISCGLAERPTCPWRMVLGSEGHVGTSNQLYAIGSAAKG